MSDGSAVAPDFVEPVIGFRAWHIDDDGLLRPWTFNRLAWDPGVNRAQCARDRRHRPPVTDCMCGLYALTDPSDHRLHLQGDQAVGAIAAWGDLEVHRTGFRAEHACVVALALPEHADDDQRERLERAAARYDVALVKPRELSAAARRHGAPLDLDLLPPTWPAPRRRGDVPAVDPASFGGAARGIALDAHLWVETALGAVVVGATRALAERLGATPLLHLPEPGTVLEAGDRAATATAEGGAFAVWAPVGGRVLAVNQRLAEDPGLVTRDPEGSGWLLRLAPRAWEDEARAVTWGTAARRHYAACLARDGARGDAFADVRLERLHALPPVRSAGEVLAALREHRGTPRFADADEVAVELGGRLRDALAADPALRARLGRLDTVVAFALRDPEATIVLDLREREARLGCGDADDPDVVLSCAAEDAYRWFTGSLDPACAVRTGDLGSSVGLGPTLRTLAVLKHLRVERWVPAPRWSAQARGDG
jgi:glycine cleavage system H protein